MINRYENPTMAEIWNRQNQLRLWAEVELAWAGQLSEVAWRDASSTMVPSAEAVAEIEGANNHEFVAFLEAWAFGFRTDEAARWIHWGLTSSDVIDTATAMQIRSANRHLLAMAGDVSDALHRSRMQHGSIVQVGRTHGQWAQPRALAVPVQALLLMLDRCVARMADTGHECNEGDFSGATGGRHDLDPAMVQRAMTALSLRRTPHSTQILCRDAWVAWGHSVSMVVTACEAIAEHYWMLAQSEVGEVEVVNGAGSSSMPHKRGNPHRAENVRGLARVARNYSSMLDESMVQRGDRDLAHSSVERIALPDLCHVAATALNRTFEIVNDYVYAIDRIEANLTTALQERVDSAVQVQNLVAAGKTRADAIASVQK